MTHHVFNADRCTVQFFTFCRSYMIVPLANLAMTLALLLLFRSYTMPRTSLSLSPFLSPCFFLVFAERKNEKRHSDDSRIPSETPKIVSSRTKNERSSRRIRGRKEAHGVGSVTGKKEEHTHVAGPRVRRRDDEGKAEGVFLSNIFPAQTVAIYTFRRSSLS